MKRAPLFAIIAALSTLALASPAGATTYYQNSSPNTHLPKRKADDVIPCSATTKHTIKLWHSRGQFAVRNDCKTQWLVYIQAPPDGESNYKATNFGPGVRIAWRGLPPPGNDRVESTSDCGPGGNDVYAKNAQQQDAAMQTCR